MNTETRTTKIETLLVMMLAVVHSAFAFFVTAALKETLDTFHRFIQEITKETGAEYLYPNRSTWEATSEIIGDKMGMVNELVNRMREEFTERFDPTDVNPMDIQSVVHQYVYFFAYFAPETYTANNLAFLYFLAELDADSYDESKVLKVWKAEAERFLSFVAPVVVENELDNMLRELKAGLELATAYQEGYEAAKAEMNERADELEEGNVQAQLMRERFDFPDSFSDNDREIFFGGCDCDVCNDIRDAAEEEEEDSYDDEAWYEEMNRDYEDDISRSINRFGRSPFSD